jgi:hypothetical protein
LQTRKIPRQRKRKSNNKEDQIYFEVLEGAISWRYLPKFLISVLFFRRFFCFIAYSHKSIRPSLISTRIEKGTTIPEADFDHQAIKLNTHKNNQRGGVIKGKKPGLFTTGTTSLGGRCLVLERQYQLELACSSRVSITRLARFERESLGPSPKISTHSPSTLLGSWQSPHHLTSTLFTPL